jgi:hypothetical protein
MSHLRVAAARAQAGLDTRGNPTGGGEIALVTAQRDASLTAAHDDYTQAVAATLTIAEAALIQAAAVSRGMREVAFPAPATFVTFATGMSTSASGWPYSSSAPVWFLGFYHPVYVDYESLQRSPFFGYRHLLAEAEAIIARANAHLTGEPTLKLVLPGNETGRHLASI